ncbi:MAG: hypothetical protein QOE30_2894, partial [Mycobacterium sp.]|uniref:hypothetical protein n=1 Tax=Mycobacterium sp. TaxID=1785 RepID=UPI0028BC350A
MPSGRNYLFFSTRTAQLPSFGLEDHGGICDHAAFSVNSCRSLAYVAGEVRYEWELIAGVHGANAWRA